MDSIRLDIDGKVTVAGGVVYDKVCRRFVSQTPLTLPYSDGAPAIPSPAFVVDFQIGQYSFSGVRVDQLKVQGDVANKPFKGIRTFTKSGRYEVRW
jgi:hypothetical protein